MGIAKSIKTWGAAALVLTMLRRSRQMEESMCLVAPNGGTGEAPGEASSAASTG